MNPGVQISLSILVFSSFGYVLGNEIAGLYLFPWWLHYFTLPQQVIPKGSNFSTVLPTLVISLLLVCFG
jgi:hypothetical protein